MNKTTAVSNWPLEEYMYKTIIYDGIYLCCFSIIYNPVTYKIKKK